MNTTPVHSITPEMLTQSSKENPVITNASIADDQLDMCHFMSEGQVVVFQENGAITVSQHFDMSACWQDEYVRHTVPLGNSEHSGSDTSLFLILENKQQRSPPPVTNCGVSLKKGFNHD